MFGRAAGEESEANAITDGINAAAAVSKHFISEDFEYILKPLQNYND
jgi:hypothetical protein